MEKYDKAIWRINGTVLLLACLAAICVSLVVGYKLASDALQTRHVFDVVNVDPATKKKEQLSLGYFEHLKGTDFTLVHLKSEQTYNMVSYAKVATGVARNYLLFNKKTKESQWIWPNNSFLALGNTVHISDLAEPLVEEKRQRVRGLVFEFAEADSNGDNLLNENDLRTLQYFDLASKKTISVVSQIDKSLNIDQTADDEVIFFYYRQGKTYFKTLTLSLMSFSVEKEVSLVQ